MSKENFNYNRKIRIKGETFYFHVVKIGQRRYIVNVLKKTKEEGIINEVASYTMNTSNPRLALKYAISYFREGIRGFFVNMYKRGKTHILVGNRE